MDNLTDNFFTQDEVTLLTALDAYEPIEQAMAVADTIDLLPDDPEAFLDKLSAMLTDNYNKNVKILKKLEKDNPVFFTQILALFKVLSEVRDTEANTSVEKLDLEAIKKQERKEIIDQVLKIIKGEN